jgi:hypothetical protein
MKRWHADMLQGLDAPEPVYIGRFRGEPGQARLAVDVRVAEHPGVAHAEVTACVSRFHERLSAAVAYLDERVPAGMLPGANDVDAVIALCAWAHAEWVRIHPFANGNGRTSRLWANWIAMRYGLPPFVRLRPRPGSVSCVAAAEAAMRGRWRATIPVFEEMLRSMVQAAGEIPPEGT